MAYPAGGGATMEAFLAQLQERLVFPPRRKPSASLVPHWRRSLTISLRAPWIGSRRRVHLKYAPNPRVPAGRRERSVGMHFLMQSGIRSTPSCSTRPSSRFVEQCVW